MLYLQQKYGFQQRQFLGGVPGCAVSRVSQAVLVSVSPFGIFGWLVLFKLDLYILALMKVHCEEDSFLQDDAPEIDEHVGPLLFFKEKTIEFGYQNFGRLCSSPRKLAFVYIIISTYLVLFKWSAPRFLENNLGFAAFIVSMIASLCAGGLMLIIMYLRNGILFSELIWKLQIIQSFWVVGSCISFGLSVVAAVEDEQCTSSSYFFKDFECKRSGGQVPGALLTVCMLLPALLSLVAVETKWQAFITSYLISAASIVYCIVHRNAKDSIIPFLLIAAITLLLLVEIRCSGVKKYLVYLKLRQKEKDENSGKILADTTAAEMRKMIGNLAHDLKTPMAAMFQGIEEVKRKAVSKDLQEVAALMCSSYHQLSMITNRCLDFTVASNGLQLSATKCTFNLYEVVKRAVKSAYVLQGKIIDGTDSFLRADRSPFICTEKQWLFDNLLCVLCNAAKYSQGSNALVLVNILHVTRTRAEVDAGIERRHTLTKAKKIGRSDSNNSLTRVDIGGLASVDAEEQRLESSVRSKPSSDRRSARLHAYLQPEAMHSQHLPAAAAPSRQAAELVEFVRFEVLDTAPPLDDETMSTLFLVHSPKHRTQKGGSGLGLYTLARRIDALKGFYGARRREDGEGNVFWFDIPYEPNFELYEEAKHKQAKDTSIRTVLSNNFMHAGSTDTASVRFSSRLPFTSIDATHAGSNRSNPNSFRADKPQPHSGIQSPGSTQTSFRATPRNSLRKEVLPGSPVAASKSNRTPAEGKEGRFSFKNDSITVEEISNSNVGNSDSGAEEQQQRADYNLSRSMEVQAELSQGLEVERVLKLKVLLVEDCFSVVKLTVRNLQSKGHEVVVAENGQVALDKLLEYEGLGENRAANDRTPTTHRRAPYFDVILMDMQMPIMDGFEATERIRQMDDEASRSNSIADSTTIVAANSAAAVAPMRPGNSLPFMAVSTRFSNPNHHSSSGEKKSSHSDSKPASKEIEIVEVHGISNAQSFVRRSSMVSTSSKTSDPLPSPSRHLIVALSANPESHFLQRAFESGVDAFMVKPFSYSSFIETYCRLRFADPNTASSKNLASLIST